VLAQYPATIAEECCDPRLGLSRGLRFLAIADVVEWCDARLAHHHRWAAYIALPKRLEREPAPEQRSRAAALLADAK
jgi:hypothetical protein